MSRTGQKGATPAIRIGVARPRLSPPCPAALGPVESTIAKLKHALILALLALSCRRPDYFPMPLGREWRYAVSDFSVADRDTTGLERSAASAKVTAVRTDPQLGRVCTVRMDGVQFLEGLWYFQPRREGLFVLRTWHGEEFAGWIQVLSLPLKPGRIWYGSPDREESFEVVAVETVTVPAGSFPRCLRFRARTAESGFILDFWLAPGVGLVKWQQPVGRGRFQTGTLTEPVRG